MAFSTGWDFGAVLRRRLVRVEGGSRVTTK
jgi:hypothetical protein